MKNVIYASLNRSLKYNRKKYVSVNIEISENQGKQFGID